jgi:predicted MFS family arabinose efflux permease
VAAGVAFAMKERPYEHRDLGSLWMHMKTSARLVAREPALRFAIGFSALLFTLLRMGMYLNPAFLDAAGMSLPSMGAVMAALSLVGACAALRIERVSHRLGEASLVWGLPLCLAAAYLLLERTLSVWAVGLLAVPAIVNGVYSPFSKELINREVSDSSLRATVLGMESMVRRLSFGAFAPLCGLLMDADGVKGGLWASALLGLLGGVGLLIMAYSRQRRGLNAFAGEMDSNQVPLVDKRDLTRRRLPRIFP